MTLYLNSLYSVFVGGPLVELVQESDFISLYSVFVGGLGELVQWSVIISLYCVFVGRPPGELVQLSDIIFSICRWSRRACTFIFFICRWSRRACTVECHYIIIFCICT